MKLSYKIKLSYGIGGIADNAMFTLSMTYLLFYLTTIAGINPAIAGTITALGSIWEAVCGPIFGYVSDNIETKYGKRKPFLLAAAFPIAIISTLLFSTFDINEGFKVVYYIIMMLLFWTFFSVFFVPYMAWGAEITDDYKERTVLRSYSYVFNQVGTAIGMVLPTVIVDCLVNLGKSEETGWTLVGLFVGICAGASLLVCALSNKTTDIKDFKKKNNRKLFELNDIKGILKSYIQIFKLKPMKYLLGSSLAFLIGDTIFTADKTYYMTYNLNFNADKISLSMVIITVSGVLFVPLLNAIANKTDKKNVLIGGMLISGLTIIAFGIIGVSSFLLAAIFFVVYTGGHTVYWQIMPSIIYDMCEVDEICSGVKRSGTVISFQSLAESISIALGAQILGLLLEFAGFDSLSETQPQTALDWIDFNFAFIPGVFMLIAGVIFIKYPVNEAKHKRILKLLKDKEECLLEVEEENKILKELGIK